MTVNPESNEAAVTFAGSDVRGRRDLPEEKIEASTMQDLSLHILDVAENGITAGADLIRITVEEDTKADKLTITIEDNGRGMDPEFLAKVLDPFVYHTHHPQGGAGAVVISAVCSRRRRRPADTFHSRPRHQSDRVHEPPAYRS